MSTLSGALASDPGREILRFEAGGVTASDVLQRSGRLERTIGEPGGRLILSMDPSPATLLALLVMAERHNCCLMLGRPTVDMAALETRLRPDWIVHGPEQAEQAPRPEGFRSETGPGVFLLTSGTTGAPKVVHQTLSGLLGRILTGSLNRNRNARWLLTYETHSFAGLQVVLSAVFSEGLLVVPESRNPAALAVLGRAQEVTHISGTPTFWRSMLMAAGPEGMPSLRQITIGGEAVDQATLDRLAHAFPAARISHIYASTEAGALFAVHDGRAGFPKEWLESELPGGVMLRIRDGVLEVRSPRRMLAYVSGERMPVSEDGWLITGDLVRVEGDRVFFCGRQDHVINIAGLKISPLEVEEVLLAQPGVLEAQVYGIPSPITGAIPGARVVLQPGLDVEATLRELRGACARALPRHAVPRRFEAVDSVVLSSTGKKAYGK